MRKPASSSLQARLSPKKMQAKGLHEDRFPPSFEVFNYVLAMYATEDIIYGANEMLEIYEQSPEVSDALYTKKLYTKPLRCVNVYEEKRVKPMLAGSLDQPVCDDMSVYLGQHPCALLKQLARYAGTLIKIFDISAGSLGKPFKYRKAVVSSRRH